MIVRPQKLERLLSILRTLPSVGPKMSERIALHLLRLPEDKMRELLESVRDAYEKVRPCPVCGYWDDSNPCKVCQDTARDQTVLCVIESPQDLLAMSRVRNFNGLYHVLGGALSPLDGIGPQDLRIELLLQRLESGQFKEVILALNPDMEGETTTQYLLRQIHALVEKQKQSDPNFFIQVTRLAQGLPAGAELEYMDETTLLRAFDGRKALV